MSPNRGAIYADYARHYDPQGQSHWGRALANFTLTTLLPRYARQPRSALDLACGTGAATTVLAEAGLRTVGLDRSRTMLAIAQAKAQTAQVAIDFVCADLRAFAFRRPFDLITCTFDSLNYLTDPADLTAAFACVRDALAPTGLFVCDLVTARAFTDSSDETLDLGSVCYSWTTTWDAATHLAITAITCTATRNGQMESSTEYHCQRAYDQAAVFAAFRAAGLRPLDTFAGLPFNRPSLATPDEDTQRIIYVAARTLAG